MKALLLNAVLEGGGGTAIYRLRSALEYANIDCQTIVFEKKACQSDTVQIKRSALEYISEKRQKRFLAKYTDRSNDNGKMFFFPMPFFHDYFPNIVDEIVEKPDFIIAIWTTAFADAKTFYKLHEKYRVPVLWYIADMEPLTGGCHYTYSCNKNINGCFNCPAMKSWMKAFPVIQWFTKRRYLEKADVALIMSSSYMLNKAEESGITKRLRKYLLLRGMDGDIFNSNNRGKAREKFGINIDKIVFFWGATSLTDTRKGGDHVLSALARLKEKIKDNRDLSKIVVLYAGKDDSIGNNIPFTSTYAGYMTSQSDLADLYKASDAYICPTLQDSGPMMVSESILCGTPVIGYKTGVVMDVVKDGITGFQVDVGDVDALAKAMKRFIDLPVNERSEMRDICSEYGKKNLVYQAQANTFLDILREERILDGNHNY